MLYSMFLCFCVFMNLEMEKPDREPKLSVNYSFLIAYFDICLDEAIALSQNKKERCPDVSKSIFFPIFQQGVFIVCFLLIAGINR